MHLSKMAEDMIIYSSKEFGYLTLADAFSTGSSLMPQKKNADSLELIRGKSGRLFGQMSGLMMSIKGLPSCYNKDLQEDKEPLFDNISTTKALLTIAEGVVSTVKLHPDKMRSALNTEMLATDVAYYCVRKGVPFRKAHHIAGEVVQLAEDQNCEMHDLSLESLRTVFDFDDDVSDIWDYEAAVLEQAKTLQELLG